MKSYRGVVEEGGIVLTEPADLPVGAIVEVRVIDLPREEGWDEMDEEAREAAFARRLLRLGIIGNLQNREPELPGERHTPVQPTPGPPLTEILIQERR